MNTFDQEIMARTAIGEARGEGITGMRAVMWTGINRFTSKKWFAAPTLAGTFLKKLQYDCWVPDDPNYSIIANLDMSSAIYSMVMPWAQVIIEGKDTDLTLGATHYFSDSIPPPTWVAGATETVKIGRHSFFKDVA